MGPEITPWKHIQSKMRPQHGGNALRPADLIFLKAFLAQGEGLFLYAGDIPNAYIFSFLRSE
jgi:hypothetical protein